MEFLFHDLAMMFLTFVLLFAGSYLILYGSNKYDDNKKDDNANNTNDNTTNDTNNDDTNNDNKKDTNNNKKHWIDYLENRYGIALLCIGIICYFDFLYGLYVKDN